MPRSIKRETEYERARRKAEARVRAVEACAGLPVVEGLLNRGEVRLLTGPMGAGKTVYAARLGAAVSRGEPFEGRATRRTNVLVLAAGTPAEWAFGVNPHLPATDRWFRVAFGRFALDYEEGMFRLRAMVEFRGVGLIVVDALREAVERCEFRWTLERLVRLCREKNAAALVVHGRRVAGFEELRRPDSQERNSLGSWENPLPHGFPFGSR